ncbi:hypothetical protein EON65_43370 [archaeon]|nr:MAG: hypothetical protein EON65_43370 [archaeon]
MTWTIGRVRDSFIGILCTGSTYWTTKGTPDAILQPCKADAAVCIPRRVCEAKKQTWVVVVGTTEQYKDIVDFAERKCLVLKIAEMKGNNKSGKELDGYRVMVEDEGEGVVSGKGVDETVVGKRAWDDSTFPEKEGEGKDGGGVQGVKIAYVVPSISALGVHPLVAAKK